MVGSFWGCRLLGAVRASGLHAHFANVEYTEESGGSLKLRVAGSHDRLIASFGKVSDITSNIFLQYRTMNKSDKNLRCRTGLLLGGGGVACAHF